MMPVYSFPCPHCSTHLRLQDRRLIGRTIDCPDCRQPVVIQDAHGAGVVGRSASSFSAVLENDAQMQEGRKADQSGWPSRLLPRWASKLSTPVGIAWMVATALSAVLIGGLISSSSSKPPAQPHITPQASDADSRETNEQPIPHDVQGRLESLHDQLVAYGRQTGDWPSGTAGDASLAAGSRFSWLAVLASQSQPHGPQPRWDRPWDDPVNERFVRRRQDRFLNPLVEQESGDDRYPASHYVGVTGIGADSASLPADHPRAGIFGARRTTDLEEVPDGRANTMLVAGVERRLGSWAAGGTSTLRAFTEEPYVNGPDGFGTGQADGMYVLMADGSVRLFSSDVDASVVHRLATRAGRSSTERATPDDRALAAQRDRPDAFERTTEQSDPDPFDAGANGRQQGLDVEAKTIIEQIAKGAELPIDVPLADPATNRDIASLLTQPIARFDQSTPVPAHELLQLVEEMAGVEIKTDRLPAGAQPRLKRRLTLSLQETTVGEVLSGVLKQLDMIYRLETDRIEIVVSPHEQ